jgi:polyhydroxybutyrate depolymerase
MMRWLAALILIVTAFPAWACGIDSDCALGDRTYRIFVPPKQGEGKIGAVIFFHGYRGNAAQIMGDKSLIALAEELHVALVAPQSVGDNWRIPGNPRHRTETGTAEYDYTRRLLDDIEQRFNVDRHKLLASGFSAGGMLVWNLACHQASLFTGYAPISGTFWAPVPESCPGPIVSVMHFHGTSDTVVPLGGRSIADGKQGEVATAIAMFTRIGKFGAEHPVPAKDLDCTRRENPAGQLLELCTHPGGHIYKADFVRRAWQELHIAGGEGVR